MILKGLLDFKLTKYSCIQEVFNMSKRLSLYLNDFNETKYERVQAIAEAKGKTTIEELLDGYLKYAEMQKNNSTTINEDADIKAFTLYKGGENIGDYEYISFYGKEIFNESLADGTFVAVYVGKKGKKLLFFGLNEASATYRTFDNLDSIADYIAFEIYHVRGLDPEYYEDGTQEEYVSVANKFCEKVGLVGRGTHIEFLDI